jgi:DNA invertase Pin-like site-specific DNA recombinase
MFRAGLYARVSTNHQQTLTMQNWAMRDYVGRRGWTIALQVREVNSGAARREAREKLLAARRSRRSPRPQPLRARANGKRWAGRQPRPSTLRKYRKLHRASVSKSQIARRLKIGRTSVRRMLG